MAQLCHDQFDHPLLWCESKRRVVEKRIAEESRILGQQRKEQAQVQKQRDYNDVSEHKCQCTNA